MDPLGKALSQKKKEQTDQNAKHIQEEETKIARAIEAVINAGKPAEKVHERGQLTAMERIEILVDENTFLPFNSLYDPKSNVENSTGVITGLASIEERYCMVVAFDNKVLAGAWIPGQAEQVLRATDMAQTLNIPLVWVLNCSGVKLTHQEELYAGRRSGGQTFFRHAEMNTEGVPVLAAVYGANPAGGGYHGISPTAVYAHKDASIAVGGGGIMSGMSPKGTFDVEGAERLIEAAKHFKQAPPGSAKIHYKETGFFRSIHETEEEVLKEMRKVIAGLPRYDASFFRVAEPKKPAHAPEEIYNVLPHNQRAPYDATEVIARLVDNSEHMEFRPDFGPEVYTGLVKIDGFLMGIITNHQGFLGKDYPKYAEGKYMGIGGKLYRDGLIKMNEFVSLCGRDKVPIIWVQDTSGIDVGDIAEKAELLGLGQGLIYSIEDSKLPMMCLVLRKGSAASHYVMGGPQGRRNNVFTIGTATTEIYVMHGETAAAAAFSRRLVKEKEAGRDIQPVIDKMNTLAQHYYDESRPMACAKRGFVDEIVNMNRIRDYMVGFARSAYQNPTSICPHHQMMIPRIIKP